MMQNDIRAAVYRGGRTFAVETRRPEPPGPGEVSIRTAYCGICGTDLHVFHGHMDSRVGLNRVIGHEMSGTVIEVGRGVDNVSPGERVVVRPLAHCGDCPVCAAGCQHICENLKLLGLDSDGAMQDIWRVPSHTVHNIPDSLSLKHASLIEPVAVACHDVRLAELTNRDFSLVIGSGPIGLLVAIAARDAGASVLVSEINPSRLEIARSFGFETVNPAEESLAGRVNARTKGRGADVIFEVSGTQAGVDTMTEVAAARARLVIVAIHTQKRAVDLFQFFWRELRMSGVRVYEPEDYELAIKIVSEGRFDTDAVITDIHPLSEIQTAFDMLDSDPGAMKTLIQVGEEA